MSTQENCFITVIGHDTKGIVAKVSTLCFESGINILDINQKVIQGYFTMTMLVDVSDSTRSLDELNQGLGEIGQAMGLDIQVQHEDLFKAMHRI